MDITELIMSRIVVELGGADDEWVERVTNQVRDIIALDEVAKAAPLVRMRDALLAVQAVDDETLQWNAEAPHHDMDALPKGVREQVDDALALAGEAKVVPTAKTTERDHVLDVTLSATVRVFGTDDPRVAIAFAEHWLEAVPKTTTYAPSLHAMERIPDISDDSYLDVESIATHAETDLATR